MKHSRQPKRGLAETRPARSQCEQNAEYTWTIKSGMLPGGGNADWLKIVLHNSEPVSDTAMKEPWLHMRSRVWNEMIEEESDLWTCRALEVRAHIASYQEHLIKEAKRRERVEVKSQAVAKLIDDESFSDQTFLTLRKHDFVQRVSWTLRTRMLLQAWGVRVRFSTLHSTMHRLVDVVSTEDQPALHSVLEAILDESAGAR